MGNVYRVDSSLPDQNNAIGQANQKLRDSLDGELEIIRILEGNEWEGESKNAALAMLRILHTYHMKLIEASQMNLSAMTKLDEVAANYMNSGAIPTLWASDAPSKSFKEKVEEKANQIENYVETKAVETEKYVEDKANEAIEYTEDKAKEAIDYAKDKAEEAGDYLEDKANEAGEYLSNKASEAEAAMSNAYNSFANYISSKL